MSEDLRTENSVRIEVPVEKVWEALTTRPAASRSASTGLAKATHVGRKRTVPTLHNGEGPDLESVG
jgi:hypothetical protein